MSLFAVAIAAAMAIFASAASAQTYCVAPATGCAVDEPGLQVALGDAANNPGADSVRLGAATYTTTNAAGFTYTDGGSSDPISIIGAAAPGASKIAVAAPSMLPAGMTTYRGLTIANVDGQSSLSDLSIELPTPLAVVPANFPENQRYYGFSDQSNTQVSDVTISSPPASPIWATGIDSVDDGTQIANSTVSLGSGGGNYPSYGLDETNVNSNDTTITGSTISADQPVRDTNADPGGQLVVDRSTLQARQIGIAAAPATVSISSTLVDLGANVMAVGFDIGFENANSATDSTVLGNGLTIVGSGDDQVGLSVHAFTDNDPLHPEWVDTATANLRNTVIDLRGVNSVAINRNADFDGTANVNIDYSSLDPTTISESNGTATVPGATTLGAHNLNPPDNGFGDFNTGVFRLAAGSPLIDAGTPGVQYLALDHDGNARAILGLPGCTPRQDIGAYEFVPSPALTPSGCPVSTPPGATPPATTTLRCRKGKKPKRVKGKLKCVKKKHRK